MESTQKVDWGGRTYGQLTPDEQRRVREEAAAALQAELRANADRIAAVLDDDD